MSLVHGGGYYRLFDYRKGFPACQRTSVRPARLVLFGRRKVIKELGKSDTDHSAM